MLSATRIALAYAVISAIATCANLLAQAASMAAYQGAHAIELSVLVGTAAGMPIKYALEKRHVFRFQADDLRHDAVLFFLYGTAGVFTTAVFWGIEAAFHLLFASDAMRYLGGAIGLALGSWIKYHLDKRFVFKRAVT